MNKQQRLGFAILRFGLAAMYIWFGYSELTDTFNWIGWVPPWAMTITGLSAETIVYINGTFEIVAGILLALNIFLRPVAILLAAHLAIITYEIGINEIGLRDFALTAATLAVAFLAESKKQPQPNSGDGEAITI